MFIAFLKFLMRWFQRLVVLAGLIALGFWLFFIGREHQIYLDNRALGEFKPLELVKVSINGGKVSELFPRERDVRKVVGRKFELKVEVPEIYKTPLVDTIYLDFSKDIMINLPAFVSLDAGDRRYIIPAPK